MSKPRATKTFVVTMTVTVDAHGSWRHPTSGRYVKMPVTARDVATAIAETGFNYDSFDIEIAGTPKFEAPPAPAAPN